MSQLRNNLESPPRKISEDIYADILKTIFLLYKNVCQLQETIGELAGESELLSINRNDSNLFQPQTYQTDLYARTRTERKSVRLKRKIKSTHVLDCRAICLMNRGGVGVITYSFFSLNSKS